ncbi:unnamed protein product [Didymodactylos carnosus]|uniref:Pyridoxal phosphate phosphatase PHOSPHO2 n=1 Tax=Didymodactylos carnosus TaxID=1234261 RepID=A0A814A997_9BILA|nr:unnamed protein product [Didymodactylos carnosus]CAF1014028.1 unnamed protein product [Didymodactylos carnosus]CAF3691129.1 unnamed protein product [Didymodactylos carnosus]CAF3782994.1 unnamed protein product [Didymodactylos carnosus]
MNNKKILCVCDFDHTIVDQNTDIVVTKFIPEGEKQSIVFDKKPQCWTYHMEQLFQYFQTIGIKKSDYIRCMQQMQLTEHFKELLLYLSKISTLIIVSDSNQLFIDTILKHNGLDHVFQDIFTNPASYDENKECLLIQPYGRLDEKSCNTCPINMCKGEIIDNYRKTFFSSTNNQLEQNIVIFIGDGHNDVCAAKSLKKNDLVCARQGYKMAVELKQYMLNNSGFINASYMEWNNGKDIQNYLEKFLNKCLEENDHDS